MKWYIRLFLFCFIFICLIQVLSILFMTNKSNLSQFGVYNKTKYELLSEENDTIDVIFLGDSLIYSSIIPAYLYNKYGFTSYDCAEPAQTIDNTLKYLKIAIESQHPKVVFVESDVIFRNMDNKIRRKNYMNRELKNYFPILKFHNNWKKIGQGQIVNPLKGYKINLKTKGIKKDVLRQKEKTKNSYNKSKIIKQNKQVMQEIIDTCKKNNIKIILIDIINYGTWSYERNNAVAEFAQKNDIVFLDTNLIEYKKEIGIDWSRDTKDMGKHLNFSGAKKFSDFIGNYITGMNIVEDHRNDEKYSQWNKAYEFFLKKSLK